MTPTQRPTFSRQVIGDGAGFVYLLASGGSAPGSINFDFTTGSLPAGITFTRASIGTYNSNTGILTTASNNVARFNYVGGVANLLIEGSATNLVLQSNNFSNAAWTMANGPTLTAAQFISPDGANNGWTVTGSASTGMVYGTATYSAIPYVMSIWAKRISGPSGLGLWIQDNAVSGSSFATTSTLTRYSGSRTPLAGSFNYIVVAWTATDTHGIYGAQVEAGTVATSYIPTTTAAVTRSADSAVFTIPSGIGHLTYTFDDNSTQLVTVSAGSYTIPVTLNRPNIKSIVGSA